MFSVFVFFSHVRAKKFTRTWVILFVVSDPKWPCRARIPGSGPTHEARVRFPCTERFFFKNE